MLGLQRGKVQLVDHHTDWLELFKQEKNLLQNIFGDIILDIQHIGSTAVPGLSAKPILDINICVESLAVAESMIEKFQEIGYEYRPFILDFTKYGPEKQEEYFVKGPEINRTHHIHVTVFGTDYSNDYMIFRDYLRQYPERARQYGELKKELAKQFSTEREKYTKGKREFIEETFRLAKADS